jgi:hypothetical protein
MAKQKRPAQPAEMALASLAEELLLGRPSGGPRYHQREYPEGKRARIARDALAQLLRAEAPGGRYVNLLAEMIAPRPKGRSVIPRQTVEFVQPRAGKRASGQIDIKIANFVRKQLRANAKKRLSENKRPFNDPERLDKLTAHNAAVHFHVSKKTIRNAWARFKFPLKTRVANR